MNACRLCQREVFNGMDAHPCCVFWIEELGQARCTACDTSITLAGKQNYYAARQDRLVAARVRAQAAGVA